MHNPINFTEKAIAAAKEALEEGEDGIRVGVLGGGCSGYSYALDFAKEAEIDDDDIFVQFDGLKVWIDQHSASLLKGTIIDYVVTTMRKGFVFNNPNAKTTCGCGSSFS
jgi:iron-sulfur cluster assembly accessory protein